MGRAQWRPPKRRRPNRRKRRLTPCPAAGGMRPNEVNRSRLAMDRGVFYLRSVNAQPLLVVVARLLSKHRLEVVMIGNAAAALQGSPVTTLDVDFMFRKTARNLSKLKALADDLDAMVLRPYYPMSELYRVVRDRDGVQLDFMARVDGIRSFEALRARAMRVEFEGCELLVASLDDIIRSKESAAREQDLAVLPILRRTRDEKEEGR